MVLTYHTVRCVTMRSGAPWGASLAHRAPLLGCSPHPVQTAAMTGCCSAAIPSAPAHVVLKVVEGRQADAVILERAEVGATSKVPSTTD